MGIEYRPPTVEEDQAGDDGFVHLAHAASKGVRRSPEVPLQVIHSNEQAIAAVGREGRFESETTLEQFLDATLKMIDLKFGKGHALSGTVLLLRAATELPHELLSRLTIELKKQPRPCLGVIYVPNVGTATAIQPLILPRVRSLLAKES